MAKGRFIPRHPQKYMGNAQNILFRSSWELTVMKFFDNSTSVSRWASEEVHLPYISPKDGRVHQYYPDFLFEMINANQEIERWLVEVKPLKETSIEHAKTAYDRVALAVNEAKWKAAEMFCQVNNLKFKVITELDIYRMMPRANIKTPKKRVSKPGRTTVKTKSTTTKRTNDKRKSKNAST